jgi:O-antigen/teichoic acid export membrane protein
MTNLQRGDINDHGTSQAVAGTAWLAAADVITMFLGLALVVASTRKFSADAYGSYLLLYLISNLLLQLTSLGFDSAIPRFLAISETAHQKELLVNTFLTLRLIAFGLMTLIALALAPLLFKLFGVEQESTALIFVVIMFFLGGFTSTMQSILQGFMLFKQIAIWDILSSLLNLLLLFFFILLPISGSMVLVWSYSVAYLIAGVYMFVVIPVKKYLLFEFTLVRDIIKFGFPLQLNDMLSFFYSRIDTFMIAAMLPAADIAYFAVARKIPESLSALFDSFNTVFFPWFSRLYSTNEHENAELLLRNALRLATFISLCLAGMVLLFGKDIMNLLFSSKYIVAAPVFFILMVALALNSIGSLLGRSLVAVGEVDKPAKINLVHAGIGLFLNWLLIPVLGIVGAGITEVAGPTVTNPLNYIFLTRKFPMRVLSAYLKPLVIFAGWAVLIYLIPIDTFLFKIVTLILFVSVNAFFSVITKDDFVFMQVEGKKTIKAITQMFEIHKDAMS